MKSQKKHTRPNTYTQCYFHLVFAVKYHEAMIGKEWKDELEKYITGIIRNNGHKLLAIGSMPDHIHIFIGYNVNQLIPDLVENIKTSSSSWVKKKHFLRCLFHWQEGYGSFTHSRSQIKKVADYIMTQEAHHKKRCFKEEYLALLKRNEVKYDEHHLFEFFDGLNGWN